MPPLETSAALIAMDLATAIHNGHLGPDAKVPSQTQLMKAYGVSMATAASALAKVREAGLTWTSRGRGVFVTTGPGGLPGPREEELCDRVPDRPQYTDAIALYRAGDLLQSQAATTYLPDDPDPTTYVHDRWDYEEHEEAPRPVPVAALAALDRVMLRALGDAMIATARRVVGYGPMEADRFLVVVARSVLFNGAARPAGQEPIAVMPGPPSEADGAVRRLFPREPSADPGSPF